MPSTREDFWQAKFDANVARDRRQLGELEALGWSVLVIWECGVKDEAAVEARLAEVTGQIAAAAEGRGAE